jgi:tetratricopeptide (TPR) repeat protein
VSESSPADRLAARAEAFIDLDRHAEAVPLLRQALASDPDDVWLLDLLAQAQLEAEPAAAHGTALRLVSVLPESYRGHLLASIAASEAGDRKAAERHAREAVDRAPWEPVTHARLAEALVGRRHKLKEAMREAERTIELAPDSSLGYVTAGNVHLRRGKTRAAKQLYARALAVDPTSRAAQVNVGITNKVSGRLDQAFGDVDAILRFDPRDESARRLLDAVVYTTLVHLQWLALLALFIAAALRVG